MVAATGAGKKPGGPLPRAVMRTGMTTLGCPQSTRLLQRSHAGSFVACTDLQTVTSRPSPSTLIILQPGARAPPAGTRALTRAWAGPSQPLGPPREEAK